MFNTYKLAIDTELKRYVEQMGKKSLLRDACAYALNSSGKRLRPILVLMTAEAIGGQNVLPAALSVEFFHTASLIADDLPCMDNDAMRRGVPSLHIAFGESTAVLASYTLIAAGYGGIYENGKILKENPLFADSADPRAVKCLEAATRCAGILGATQGQHMDLFPPNLEIETIRDIIYKKTVTLFEICFLFGWFFGGGDFSVEPLLKKCAYHLGMAFQIGDDLDDDLQDDGHTGGVNIASAMGRKKAILSFEEEIALLEKSLKEIGLWTKPFQDVYGSLTSRHRLFSGSSLLQGSVS